MKLGEQEKGVFFGRKKGNALTRLVNALANIRVEFVDKNKSPEVLVSDSNTVIKLPQSVGGGIPDGFEEEEFDVVNEDNTPGRRIFLTKQPEEP